MISMKCVVILLLQLLFSCYSQSVVGPESYVIGNKFNLTWDDSSFSSSTVDISLSYSNGQSLLLASNIQNTGNVSLIPNFERDPSHLLVPDNTTGQWTVSSSDSTSQSSDNIQIYQPLMFTIMGGVLDLNTSFQFTVTLNDKIDFSNANFTAYLVYLNNEGMWVAPYMFETMDTGRIINSRVELTVMFPKTFLNQTRDYYLVVFANTGGISFSGINAAPTFNDWDYLFIPYDSSKIKISLQNTSLVPYSSVQMNVTVGYELEMSYVYVSLKDNYLLSNQSGYYQLQCNSSMPSQYNQYGWLLNGTDMKSPLYGNHTMELYYNPMTNFDNVVGTGSSYLLYTFGMIEILDTEEIPAIVLEKDDYMDDNKSVQIKKGETINFHITSLAFNTPVTIYAEWIQYYANATNEQPIIYGNKSVPVKESVSQKNPQEFKFRVPKEAEISDDTNKEITLRLYTFDCQGNEFGNSEYVFSLKKKSHSTNKLSAGAIVGIVCAGVLICGLAAWYLAMSRNPKTDGYSELGVDKD